MIRVQIKDNNLRFQFVIELIEKQYKIYINNRNGNCLFIRVGRKECTISHWTNDNPIKEFDKTEFRWLINCIQ